MKSLRVKFDAFTLRGCTVVIVESYGYHGGLHGYHGGVARYHDGVAWLSCTVEKPAFLHPFPAIDELN